MTSLVSSNEGTQVCFIGDGLLPSSRGRSGTRGALGHVGVSAAGTPKRLDSSKDKDRTNHASCSERKDGGCRCEENHGGSAERFGRSVWAPVPALMARAHAMKRKDRS
jgi:hypothetical protein